MRVIKKRQKKKAKVVFIFILLTVRLLESGHLEEDYPITTLFENKRFSSFFANGPIIFVNFFEDCFPRGQVSSNGFKVFNGGLHS